MIDALKKYYRRQQFNPGVGGPWLNPFYFARKELFREVSRLAPALRGRLLDVGCGTKPYRHLFTGADEYVGLEYDSPASRAAGHADCFYDGTVFPLADASCDGVVCNQVLEHVFNPDEFVREIARVLKPGGGLLLTVPFVWDEHEQPHDCARFTSFGVRGLLERGGFVVHELRKTNADARVLFQLVNAYLYKVLLTSDPRVNVLLCATVIAPITVFGSLLARLLPANPDLYLDLVVFAKRRGQEIPLVDRKERDVRP